MQKRFISLFIYLLAFALQGDAQTFFSKKYTGHSTNVITGMNRLPNGDYAFTILNNIFGKCNSSGDLLWLKKLSPAISFLYGVTSDPIGNIYITGLTDPASSIPSQNDILLLKLSPNGNIIWSRRLPYGGADMGQAINYDNGGISLIANLGDTLNPQQGANKYISFLRLDTSGNIIYTKSFYRIGSYFFPSSIKYYSGMYLIDGDYASGTSSNGDYFLLALDLNGDLLWCQILGANGQDQRGACFVNTDGFIYAAFSHVDGFQSGPLSTAMLKLNTNGQVIWRKTFDTQGSANVRQITSDPSGNPILTLEGNLGIKPRLLLKTDTSGNVLISSRIDSLHTGSAGFIDFQGQNIFSLSTWGSSQTPEAIMTCLLYSNGSSSCFNTNFAIAPAAYQTFEMPVQLYPISLPLPGWIAHDTITDVTFSLADSCFFTGINDQDNTFSGKEINIYPTPSADGIFSMDYTIPDSGFIWIYDNLGRPAERYYLSSGTNHISLDLTKHPSGIYFYRIEMSNLEIKSGKLLILK